MKSPFTGKEMKRVYEQRTWKFRGEDFKYIHTAWLCEDTGEQFTTDESDTAGYIQVTNQYREKYGIPYTDEIVAARERYGISAAKMALILGIGINQYRLYEQGEVPNVSNGRMIRSVSNPRVMLDMVECSKNELTENDYAKITAKVSAIIDESQKNNLNKYETKRVFGLPRGAENGYAQLSLDRVKNVMLYILSQCHDVWITKMNKILFYIDFLSYRERGYALTGLSYRALAYGPVPERWDIVYSAFPEIYQDLMPAGEYVGSVLRANAPYEQGMLSESEITIIQKVCDILGSKTAYELSQISHREDAWKNNQANHNHIPYYEAFSIKAI